MFDQIEKLKRDYTDKYVVVDDSRPELQRFKGMTGQVKTVNMSGRALVRFDGGDNNIGWFDISPDFLKFVPKPEPKADEEKHAKPKPAAAAKPAEAKPAAAKPPAAPSGEKKPSVAEMLRAQAAAKAGGAAPAAKPEPKPAPVAPAPEPEPVAEAPAPKPEPKKEAAPADAGKKLSTAEILAQLRAKKS
ncbi:MAG: hypothetical protein JNK76_19015 [Planctomycetales bacterium]|nr:hypothetical protein [Planctomycetales bacterium]MBN8626020.1 hypothetical protein [Planctomycetota bacterium]